MHSLETPEAPRLASEKYFSKGEILSRGSGLRQLSGSASRVQAHLTSYRAPGNWVFDQSRGMTREGARWQGSAGAFSVKVAPALK